MLDRITQEIIQSKNLSQENATQAFTILFKNNASADQITNFLLALNSIELSGKILASAAQVMESHAKKIPFTLSRELFDCCGTGGSKAQKLFNISTIVSFVLASHGVMTAKHGNRAASSKSGSADSLEALGTNISLEAANIQSLIEQTNIAFLFAKDLHPAMKHIMPIRKTIDQKTIFNILGPLTNPLSPARQMVGVSSANDIKPMIEALYHLGKTSALVVYSENGLDEFTIFHPAQIAYFEDRGEIIFKTVDPSDFGIFPQGDEQGVRGGSPEQNADIAKNIFENVASEDQKMIVCLNAGAALWIAGKCASIEEGIEKAKELIASGEVKKCFEQYKKLSNLTL